MYRLIILAAITVALCGKAQSCISVNIPYNDAFQCELKSTESVSQFNDLSSKLINQLPKPNNPDYKAFEFVSSNVAK